MKHVTRTVQADCQQPLEPYQENTCFTSQEVPLPLQTHQGIGPDVRVANGCNP